MMKRNEAGRCSFSASGRHFWIEADETQKSGLRMRCRCRNCGQVTSEPLLADENAREEARQV